MYNWSLKVVILIYMSCVWVPAAGSGAIVLGYSLFSKAQVSSPSACEKLHLLQWKCYKVLLELQAIPYHLPTLLCKVILHFTVLVLYCTYISPFIASVVVPSSLILLMRNESQKGKIISLRAHFHLGRKLWYHIETHYYLANHDNHGGLKYHVVLKMFSLNVFLETYVDPSPLSV